MEQTERILKRQEGEIQVQRLKVGDNPVEKSDESKGKRMLDDNQSQTATAMINAAAAARSAAETHTIYDQKELEEMRNIQMRKEQQRATLVKTGNCVIRVELAAVLNRHLMSCSHVCTTPL